jgi:REP element-mobilizing transposase RayT
VTAVRERRAGDPVRGSRVEHDRFGEASEAPIPGLASSARRTQLQETAWLDASQAQAVVRQFRETCAQRGWTLLAVAVMPNHFHAVVAFEGYQPVERMLADLKAYASRALSEQAGAKRKWWTSGGSKRMLGDDRAVAAAIHYVLRKQPCPLVTWSIE